MMVPASWFSSRFKRISSNVVSGILGSHLRVGRVSRAFQILQGLGFGEVHEHIARRVGGVEFQLGALHGKPLALQFEAADVALAKHAFGVLERILGTLEILLSDRDRGVGVLQRLFEGALQVFLDRQLRHSEVLFGLDLESAGFLERDLLLIDLLLECRGVQLHEFVALLDGRAVVDDPKDGAAARHLAFDVHVLGAFQVAVFRDGDHQVAAGNGVSQVCAGFGPGPGREIPTATVHDRRKQRPATSNPISLPVQRRAGGRLRPADPPPIDDGLRESAGTKECESWSTWSGSDRTRKRVACDG